VLSSALTALRSRTALAVERERLEATRLAIWWLGERPQDEHLTAGRPCGDETRHAGPWDRR
jgi:hypothetical protein